MATAKSSAKPAAKAAAPAAKTAARPAAKAAPAKAAAPAPAPAPEVEETAGDEAVIEVGSTIKFLGYPADTPAEEQVLTADAEYAVVEITEEGNLVVQLANPDFNAKKKENAETNPKFIEVEVLGDEAELVSGPAEAEAAAPAAAPAGKKSANKAAAKAPVVKEEKADEPPADPDDLPELEGEDENVLALIQGSEDLIGTAQELEKDVADTEFKLGGVLYHIRKDKLHRSVAGEDGKPVPQYQNGAEGGGWANFIADFFNVDYRKAMYLIEIYQNFTMAKIENAADHVATMGWTKASKIAKHLNAEGANALELIELAETSTVTDLVEAIKDTVTVGGTPGEKKVRITLKFRYVEEEANAIQTTLEAARDQLGLKDIGEALAHIVTEWATQNGGGTATKKSAPAQKTAAVGAKPAAKAVAKRAPATAAA